MRHSPWFFIFAILLFLGASCSGCDDEVTSSEGHTSDRCPDLECEFCDDHDDCDDGTYCDEDDGEMVCVVTECDPGESRCEDNQAMTCDDVGSGWMEPVSCDPGVCVDGHCECESAEDCGVPGYDCFDGRCECTSGVYCDNGLICCGEGESCESVEICEDGQCQTVSECRAACDGQVCGSDGELCCEGDTPICSPMGTCAPDCSEYGDLCGADFSGCCSVGDVCIFGACQTPGEPCDHVADCGFGEYCDEGLGRCMADEFPDDIQCYQEGDFREFDVQEKWSWTDEGSTAVPLVGDVTGDGETNVVINAMTSGNIIILDNEGNELQRIEHNPSDDQYGAHWRSNPALGDVTGDGRLEIIYPTFQTTGCCAVTTHIAASNGDGETIWVAHDESGDPVSFSFNTGAISVANLNGDPSTAEVMAGAAIIDSKGRVVWNEGGDGTQYGSAGSYTGGLTIAVDLLGDGKHELVTGRHAWTLDWEESSDPEEWPQVQLDLLWENTDGADGYPAVADMDGNGNPEVILFAERTLRIIDGQTGELWCGVDPTGQACDNDPSLRTQPLADPSGTGGRGGPPTVADFDGDGRPEVGVAGNSYYTVFDVNRPGFAGDNTPEEIDEDLLDEFNQPHPDEGQLYIRWYRESQDSSQATGSSVFDFQGDGQASVVYNDECYLRVLNGVDGSTELRLQNSTGTRIEYPIVVDVDRNGRSEIVVTANAQGRSCDAWDPDDPYEERQGVFVYEDPNELWVHTRSIWNQHAYSIDNINDDGSMPDLIDDWWETHNTFRANRQGHVPLNAADVEIISVNVNPHLCPPDLDFQISIQNVGLNSIPPGLPVTLYDIDSGQALHTVYLDDPIAPGAIAMVTLSYEVPQNQFNNDLNFQIVANDDGSDDEEFVFDCNPDSATVVLDTMQCTIQL